MGSFKENRFALTMMALPFILFGGIGVAAYGVVQLIFGGSDQAAEPQTVTVTAPAPGCQDTDVDRVQRNVVWRTLNGEVLPDSPEKALALGLLPAVRASTGYAVQDGVDRIVNRFTAYYGAEQRARMFQTLSTGTAEERMDVIQRILVADRAATNLLECILRDEGRMQLATSRQPIPLE